MEVELKAFADLTFKEIRNRKITQRPVIIRRLVSLVIIFHSINKLSYNKRPFYIDYMNEAYLIYILLQWVIFWVFINISFDRNSQRQLYNQIGVGDWS